ncbi:MAG: hypothetical protein KDH96_13060, partial [Candidatus Riesia sp.]|nr:hypothetical protein [Candidatus Riesia sp.]
LYFMKFIVNDNYGRLIMNAKSSMSIDLFIYVEDRDLNNLNENDIKIIREVLIDNGIAPHLVNEFMDSIKHNRPHWLQR